jgi:hypothetical protein
LHRKSFRQKHSFLLVKWAPHPLLALSLLWTTQMQAVPLALPLLALARPLMWVLVAVALVPRTFASIPPLLTHLTSLKFYSLYLENVI